MALFQRKTKPPQEAEDSREASPVIPEEPPVIPEQAAAPAEPASNRELTLEYSPEGVFLTLWSARPLLLKDQEDLVQHFSRKRIAGLNMEKVLAAMANPDGERILVAPPQEERHYDEGYTLNCSEDMMEAYIILSPPEEGFGSRLDGDEVFRELTEVHKITFGLSREALNAVLEYPVYGIPQLVAEGQPPVKGEDGRLDWHFEKRDGVSAYRIKEVGEDEKADYKNLDLFTPVKKDQLLITRVPPGEGEPGYTVLGRKISPESGKNYLLPRGKNTYITKDGLELRAGSDGRVEVINDTVEVSNFYHVPGDVNLSVGNIDFDGDVIVDGNVLSDFTIRATGSIRVKGIVEAAALEAGGDIEIQGGVQGGGKGVLKAGDSIFVRFAEYATIQAENMIVADSLLHSNVDCFGGVEVLGGRGSIIGGNVCAGSYIAAKFLGTTSGRATGIQVGISPSHRVKIDELKGSLGTLKREMERLQGLVDELPESGQQNERQQAVRMENVRRLLQCKRLMKDIEEELAELKGHLEENLGGQVHALSEAYPGVVIAIGLAHMMVSQQIVFATFRLKEGEIEFTSCRFKQKPMRAKKRRR